MLGKAPLEPSPARSTGRWPVRRRAPSAGGSHPLYDAFEQAMMERFKRIWYKSLFRNAPVASRAEVASFLLFLNKL